MIEVKRERWGQHEAPQPQRAETRFGAVPKAYRNTNNDKSGDNFLEAVLSEEGQSLLNLLRRILVRPERSLKLDWVEVKVERHPSEAKGALWGEFSKEPLSCTSYNVPLAVRCSKRIADSPRQNCCQKVSFRLYGRVSFAFLFIFRGKPGEGRCVCHV